MRTLRILTCALPLLFCPLPASSQDLWCYNADDVYAIVDGSTVTVYHDAALYNCCPDPFAYTVIHEEQTILIEETEILTEPCYCVCCHNLWMVLEDVPAGDYQVQFSWYDYETFEYRQWDLELTVPDIGQSGTFAAGPASLPSCIDASAVPGEGDPAGDPGPTPVSWGTIKLLYR